MPSWRASPTSPIGSWASRNRRYSKPAADELQRIDHASQQRLNVLGCLLKARVVDRLHGCNGINSGNLSSIIVDLDHDVAQQHGADLVL